MSQIIYKNESYFVIGLCMDVHNELGKGFSEAVYGDSEYECIVSSSAVER